MKPKLKHQQRALFLRKKKGYSYSEIQAEVPVSKSTLSLWLRNVELTPRQKARIRKKQEERWKRNNLGEWNRAKRQAEISSIRRQARGEVTGMTNKQFFVSGLMLYWAEGNKGGKEIRFSNSDPVCIAFMMVWFRHTFKLSDDRFSLRIHWHQGQNEQELRKYWAQATGLTLAHFRKGFCKPPGTGHRKNYLKWGTLSIRVTKGADFYHKMEGWREGLIEPIISGTHL